MTDESAIIDPKRLARSSAGNVDSVAQEECDSRSDDDVLISEWRKIKNEFGDYRHNMIRIMPGFAVNNSSNILGAMHVGTEFAMFKASNGVLVENPKGPVDYAFRATKNVFGQTFQGSQIRQSKHIKPVGGNWVTNTFKQFTDLEGATLREMEYQNVARADLKLTNAWQVRSTMFGLIAWTLSAIIPDKKDSPEEIERMSVLQKTNMPGYIAERLREAVWVPQWPDHKRQMIGLGILGSGICSTLGAWRNRGFNAHGMPVFKFNKDYLFTSLLTLGSSIPLIFAPDDEKGFSGFGTIMTGRLAFLPGSIKRKFENGEKGADWYAGSMVSFQVENWLQALVGGAEKRPDGTIVDSQAIRKEAHHKATLERKERRARSQSDVAGEGREIADAAPRNQLMEVASHTPPDKTLAHAAVS